MHVYCNNLYNLAFPAKKYNKSRLYVMGLLWISHQTLGGTFDFEYYKE